MEINAKDLLEKLSAGHRDDRSKVSLYLSKGLYEAFKKTCGDAPASKVMEELMRAFIASAGSRAKSKK